MRVYDQTLNDTERREVFRTLYGAVATYRQSSNIDHLLVLAESVEGMVVNEINQPGTIEKIRNRPRTVEEAGGFADSEEVLRLLQE
jgi:hypothetical protein